MVVLSSALLRCVDEATKFLLQLKQVHDTREKQDLCVALSPSAVLFLQEGNDSLTIFCEIGSQDSRHPLKSRERHSHLHEKS